MNRTLMLLVVLAGACDSTVGGDGQVDGSAGGGDAGMTADARQLPDAAPPVPQYAELWYSADDLLVYIPLDTATGQVDQFVSSAITSPLPLGQNMITMLDDGSLLGGRLSKDDDKTYFYHLPDPPRDGSAVTPVMLGVMPDNLMLEGLYTDCDGRVYGMDTGVDDSSADGNRLLRFTGDVLAGDFSYVVVSDLASASVADIDDMGPAIANNEIRDNPGLAIDTGTIHDFDFETGSGTQVATGGTWGIHALGKELFDDQVARLYVLSSDAELFEVDPVSFDLSPSLGTGPTPTDGAAGWSGLAGPLTECDSGFTVE
jgi:hypothetical protein